MYGISSGIVIAATAAFDRFVLKRRKVTVKNIDFIDVKGEHLRFSLKFHIGQKLLNGRVYYSLRDKKNPRTAIYGKIPTLEFSDVGDNEEFILIPKELQTSPGYWVMDVKVLSSGSRINPLYKILPIETHITKEFYLE